MVNNLVSVVNYCILLLIDLIFISKVCNFVDLLLIFCYFCFVLELVIILVLVYRWICLFFIYVECNVILNLVCLRER